VPQNGLAALDQADCTTSFSMSVKPSLPNCFIRDMQTLLLDFENAKEIERSAGGRLGNNYLH
jgi:hypothetical protein